MECSKCGNNMEMVMYSDDTGDYITWVCYVCEAELEYIEGGLECA